MSGPSDRKRTQWLQRCIVVMALIAATASGVLLRDHDGGWEGAEGSRSFLSALCRDRSLPGANCAEVVGSRWGSFDVIVGEKRLVVPTSLLGMAFFLFLAVWFLLVNPYADGGLGLQWLTGFLLIGGALGSLALLLIMFTTTANWCPLCALAHACNGVIVLCAYGCHRLSHRIDANKSAASLDWASLAASLRRRLVWTAAAMGMALPVVCWAYYQAEAASRTQWRKHLDCRQALAAVQEDSDLLMHEYLSQPVHEIPLRDPPVGSVEGWHDSHVHVLIFTDYTCSACKCFEEQRAAFIDAALGPEAMVDIRHFPRLREGGAEALRGVTPESLVAESLRRALGPIAFQQLQKELYRGSVSTEFALEVSGGSATRDTMQQYRDDIQTRRAVEADIQLGLSLGVDATPTVFLDGRRVPELCLTSPAFWNAVAARNAKPLLPGERQARP